VKWRDPQRNGGASMPVVAVDQHVHTTRCSVVDHRRPRQGAKRSRKAKVGARRGGAVERALREQTHGVHGQVGHRILVS
jgi:hypothetical protein